MNAYYQLFIKSVLRLAATLVIKDDYTAKSINQYLTYSGYSVDLDDPKTWKYYLNLAGEYHVSNTMMEVISLDTLETIQFTKANLLIHRGTASEYVYGSRYYNELIRKYPDQVSLIKGIINPVDLQTAIDTPDHKILRYDNNLVESREQHLIPGLQKYIDLYFTRWLNSDYSLFEPYYYPSVLGILYALLPMQIILLRKEACKTDMAHSFHIRQYLTSFSNIGNEFDYMTDKQRLWFYRNIRYLNNHLAKTDTFDDIVQKVLTDRGYSLVSYDAKHQYADIKETLIPEIKLKREQYNNIPPAQGTEIKSVREILEKEVEIARDNYLYIDDHEKSVTDKLIKSLSNKHLTKVMESSVLDRTDSEPYSLSDTLLNHWLYLSNYGLYTSTIQFSNPNTGEVYQLSAKDAFILYLYTYNRAYNVELDVVPVLAANRVIRIPKPTKAELSSLVDKRKVPDYYIDHILKTLPSVGKSISIAAFRDTCVNIHRVMMDHWRMRHFNGDYKAEGQLHTITDRCYMDIRIDLADSQPYSQWLAERGLDFSNYGNAEFKMVYEELYNRAIGSDKAVASDVRATHASMMRIMRTLSPYTLQFLEEINEYPIRTINGKFPKLSELGITEDISIIYENPAPEILDTDAIAKMKTKALVRTAKVGVTVKDEASSVKVPVPMSIRKVDSGSVSQPIHFAMPILQEPDIQLISLPEEGQGDDINYYDPITPTDYLNSDVVVVDDQIVLHPGYSEISPARRALFLGI